MFRKILLSFLTALFVSACTVSTPPKDYNTEGVQQANEVIRGTIVSKRQIEIETDAQTGQIIGMIVGATAGSTVGGGDNENTVGAVVGAVVGMAAGKAIERSIVKRTATEYIIEKENGALTAVVSLDDKFTPDMAVLVILSNPPIIRFQ